MEAITRYFDTFDPYFENPFDAVFVAGFTMAELNAEYHRVFGEEWYTQAESDYRAYCRRA
jgi:hypothetical protein